MELAKKLFLALLNNNLQPAQEQQEDGSSAVNDQSLEKMLAGVHLLGQEAFFRVHVAPDFNNSSRNSVYVSITYINYMQM